MNILALDTATEACSAALLYKDERFQCFVHAPLQQARMILPMIDDLLQQAGIRPNQLDAVAFGQGPGSFTGLRIAAGVAQGIAMAADLPLIPVSTLATLAQTATRFWHADAVLACLDARMQEVYCGYFTRAEDGLMHAAGPEVVIAPAEAPIRTGQWLGAGNGFAAYGETLSARLAQHLQACEVNVWPQAEDMLDLAEAVWKQGGAVPVEQGIPVYLRNNVARRKNS